MGETTSRQVDGVSRHPASVMTFTAGFGIGGMLTTIAAILLYLFLAGPMRQVASTGGGVGQGDSDYGFLAGSARHLGPSERIAEKASVSSARATAEPPAPSAEPAAPLAADDPGGLYSAVEESAVASAPPHPESNEMEFDEAEEFAEDGLIKAMKSESAFYGLFSPDRLVMRALKSKVANREVTAFLFNQLRGSDREGRLRQIFESAQGQGTYTCLWFKERQDGIDWPGFRSSGRMDVGGKFVALYRMINARGSEYNYLIYGFEPVPGGTHAFQVVDVYDCQAGERVSDSVLRQYVLKYPKSVRHRPVKSPERALSDSWTQVESFRTLLASKSFDTALSQFLALAELVKQDATVRHDGLVAAFEVSKAAPAATSSKFLTTMQSLTPSDDTLKLPKDPGALIMGIEGFLQLNDSLQAGNCLTLFKQILRLAETVSEEKVVGERLDPYLSVLRARINDAGRNFPEARKNAVAALEAMKKKGDSKTVLESAFWNLMVLAEKDGAFPETVEQLNRIGFAAPDGKGDKQVERERDLLRQIKKYPLLMEKLDATTGYGDKLLRNAGIQ